MDDALSIVGMALVLGGMSALFAGPVGLILVGLLALAVSFSRSDSPTTDRTNCPDCGSPNDADADTCHYCGHALAE